MDIISDGIYNLIIFVLAVYVGYHVVWNVTPALHTPLMAVTNAISAIVIVGAMLAAALTVTPLGKAMGTLAVALAAVNVFGGFLVTRRMLEMFKKKAPKAGPLMSMNLVTLLYLIASVFIQALKGLSHPTTRAAATSSAWSAWPSPWPPPSAWCSLGAEIATTGVGYIVVGLLVGGTAGSIMAKRVEMTKMPEPGRLHAQHDRPGRGVHRHRRGGRAAVAGDRRAPGRHHSHRQPPGAFLGAAIGAITFSGSVIAFGKLSGKYKFRLFQGTPVQFSGQHLLNLVLGLATLGLGLVFMFTGNLTAFAVMLALAFVLGVLIIIPIGGADMPVVVSMLNSYSGWAAAGIGFSLNNSMLIIAGSLVGSSGAILSYIMCKAMNRSFFNVILGGFGAEADAGGPAGSKEQRPVKSGSADDASFLLTNADSVIIVPGYGLAVARAQHALMELAEKLTHRGVTVKFAIHPVAGRMPGHMNVLLAEAEVPYEQVFEMEDINSEFGQTDVVLVLGANDVVNPAAKNDPKSPIAGMPILEAYKAKTVIVNKRSMARHAGLDNELFYLDKTMMVFGDAKKVIEDMVKAVE